MSIQAPTSHGCRFHRNGVSGAPFNLVQFTDEDHRFVGIVFDEPSHVAVIDIDSLGECWRGDFYEGWLRTVVAAADASGEAYLPGVDAREIGDVAP